MLNSHSQIKAIPEIPVTIFFHHKYKSIQDRSKNLEIEVIDYLNVIQKIRPAELVDISRSKEVEWNYRSYADFVSQLFASFEIAGVMGEHPVYIDKNPYYSFFYKELNDLDDSKFIIMVRDYRANVFSRKSKVLNKSADVIYNSFRWKIFHDRLSALADRKNCLVVRYEDLVENPEKEVSNVLEFLSLPFEPHTISDFQISGSFDTQKEENTDFSKQHFSSLKKDISTDAIEKWRSGLIKEELIAIESICASIGNEFGYTAEQDELRSFSYYKFMYLRKYLKAWYGIHKDRLIYYLPIKMKLNRLKKVHG